MFKILYIEYLHRDISHAYLIYEQAVVVSLFETGILKDFVCNVCFDIN